MVTFPNKLAHQRLQTAALIHRAFVRISPVASIVKGSACQQRLSIASYIFQEQRGLIAARRAAGDHQPSLHLSHRRKRAGSNLH